MSVAIDAMRVHTPVMDRILITLTHAISQLSRRWLPAPSWEGPWPDALCRLQDLWPHDDPERLTAADWESLTVATGWETKRLTSVAIGAALAAHFAGLRAGSGHHVVLGDPAYPPLLAAIADPPLGLSVIGEPRLLSRSGVAVVGSRKASGLAIRESHALGRALADAGIAVVSGGAFGCDIAAHIGALASEVRPLPAVVVFAGGLVNVYPRQHAGVFARLRASGALLVSERLWTLDCRAVDFMARNRIISGLSQATAVMQAAEQSGAGITARAALAQGRELYVLTHPPGDARAGGSAKLLADGAHPVMSAVDLMNRLGGISIVNPCQLDKATVMAEP